MRKIIWFVILPLLFFSCEDEGKSIVLSQLSRLEFGEKSIKVDVNIIPLASPDSIVIGDIAQLKCIDDKIIILDKSQSGESYINVFNADGSFANSIGKIGRAEDEYLSISAFGIDTNSMQVVMSDPMAKGIKYYTLTGQYCGINKVDNLDLSKHIGYIKDINMYNGQLLMSYPVHSLSGNPILTFNFKDNLSEISKITTQWGCGEWGAYIYAANPLAFCGDSFFFLKPLCDTVFYSNNGSTQPYIAVNGEEYIYQDVDLADISMVDRKITKTVRGVFFVNGLLIVNTFEKQYIYDIEDGELLSFETIVNNKGQILNNEKKSLFNPLNLLYSDGCSCYAIIKNTESNIDMLDKFNVSDSLVDIVRKWNEDKNPILVRYILEKI